MATSSGTLSIVNSYGGFAQKVPSPSATASNALASFYPAINAVLIPLAHATVAYSFFLPKAAFIKEIMFSPTVSFSAGATLSLGTSAPGSSGLISAVDLTTGSINTVVTPILTGNNQTVYVTIGGSPAAGSGNLVVSYFPTILAPLTN